MRVLVVEGWSKRDIGAVGTWWESCSCCMRVEERLRIEARSLGSLRLRRTRSAHCEGERRAWGGWKAVVLRVERDVVGACF
jgi:hypothetical protein